MSRTPIDPKLIHTLGSLLQTLADEIRACDDVERPDPKLWRLMQSILEQAEAKGVHTPRSEQGQPEDKEAESLDPGIAEAFRYIKEFDDLERPDPRLLAMLEAITNAPSKGIISERDGHSEFAVLGCVHRFLTPYGKAGGTPALLQWFAEHPEAMSDLIAGMRVIQAFTYDESQLARPGQNDPWERDTTFVGGPRSQAKASPPKTGNVPNFESFDLPVNSRKGSATANKGGYSNPREVVRGRDGNIRSHKGSKRR